MLALIDHIEALVPVSDALEHRLRSIVETKVIKKGKYLHKPGRVCECTYFIVSGLLRIYYKKDEKEITDNFCAENEWITSVYSFMKHVPDNFFIESLEDSTLLAIDMEQLEKCFQDFPEMERFGRMLVSKYFVEQSERIIAMQFTSANDRYQYFCKAAPNKLARVPLGMLASYLGMTQETLSRIRARKNIF